MASGDNIETIEVVPASINAENTKDRPEINETNFDEGNFSIHYINFDYCRLPLT